VRQRNRTELGRSGEQAALNYLNSLGYILLQSNFRTRRGEADLILRDGATLVFCEVKTKRSQKTGHAAESYSRQQQQRLRQIVLRYLQQTEWDGPLRVDVLALQKEPDGPHFQVHHFQNAVSLEDNW
jgi:putative endonuclease